MEPPVPSLDYEVSSELTIHRSAIADSPTIGIATVGSTTAGLPHRLTALHAGPIPGCTHSSVPSAQFSRFQIGTRSLSVSMSQRQASKASLRWGQLTVTTT